MGMKFDIDASTNLTILFFSSSVNVVELFYQFLKKIIDLRKMYEYDIENIINLDETPIYLDSPSNLWLVKKVSRIVITKTYGKEAIRITCLLAIKANGEIMTSLIIFKGKTNYILCKKLQRLKEVIENKVIIQTQEYAWMTENNFSSYIDKFFTKINKEKRRLIIMDH